MNYFNLLCLSNWIDQGKKKRKKDVDLLFIQAIARGRVEGYRILLRLALIFDSQQFV